jgi:tRNA-specific 2-thiouridylase
VTTVDVTTVDVRRDGPVLCAMSGGVDSSVAAALLVEAGVEVAGVTLKLWGGSSDQGCCSVADVDDARRVADHLGIDHHVFAFSDEFQAAVVDDYVAAHAAGRTPNPCVECNRSIKFDRLLVRSRELGFAAVATGHHARVVATAQGPRLARGADRAKDQSYVLYPLVGSDLDEVCFPVGGFDKDDVRSVARDLGLRTAGKADSQDLCFIGSERGRAGFLGDRLTLTPGRVVDPTGAELGQVPAVEMVTVGQRRGLGVAGGPPRYVLDVDVGAATVVIGLEHDLLVESTQVDRVVWAGAPVDGRVTAQTSAHGEPRFADLVPVGLDGAVLRWQEPTRRVAPGQSVVLYDGDLVVAGGIATAQR